MSQSNQPHDWESILTPWLAELTDDFQAPPSQQIIDLLKHSQAARAEYISFCQLHSLLSFEHGLLTGLSDQPTVMASAPQLSTRQNLKPHAVTLASVLMIFALGMVMKGSNAPQETLTLNPSLETISESQFDKSEVPNDNNLTTTDSQVVEQQDQLVNPVPGNPFVVAVGSQNRPPTRVVSAVNKVQFNRDVRPILSENCFRCHGPDENTREVDLRLDVEQGLFDERDGAGAVVTRFRVEESPLFERLVTDDPDLIMPPKDSHKELTEAQIETIRKWITEGATWEDHWAFIPAVKSAVPEIEHTAWNQSPVDQFLLMEMSRHDLSPSERADLHTLVRRVYLDLTGLPPTPEQVAQFVEDKSPDAYEKLVDQLISSHTYGEHMARYWLDAARYADTHGLHIDNYRAIWPYRDWVVQAFNENMPFDQFTLEQLAGDLLDKPTQSQLVATGFNRNHVTSSEGGSIEAELLHRYATDRTETTATVWLGLTAGCAACHDHKFDPLTQKEFYQLYAFFNNTTQRGMDGNVQDTPPVIQVINPQKLDHYQQLTEDARALENQLKQKESDFLSSQPDWDAMLEAHLNNLLKDPVSNDQLVIKTGPVPEVTLNGLDKVSSKDQLTISAWIRPNGKAGSLLQWKSTTGNTKLFNLLSGRNTFELHIGQTTGTPRLTARNNLPPNQWTHVAVTIDGRETKDSIRFWFNGERQSKRFRSAALPIQFQVDGELVIPQHPYELEDLRIYRRQLHAQELQNISRAGQLQRIIDKPNSEWSPSEQQLMAREVLDLQDQSTKDLLSQLDEVNHQLLDIKLAAAQTLVMNEKPEPAMAKVLERGEYDKPKEDVTANVPAWLPPLPENQKPDRLALAQWLTDPQHPLTARVTVNRLWQQFFGTGLVKTSEDFGTQGEPPSHPELLDWLACEFVEQGWDLKAIVKLIVMSQAYQQSSVSTEAQQAKDPENRFLSRGPRYRLDAEMIRDQALAVSGLLSHSMGGPSVKPPQPAGLWKTVAYPSSDTAIFQADKGSDIYRRSLYTFWKRTSPPPNMITFDAPDRESCCVRRERTNTPLQALVLMNDPQFIDAARELARQMIHLNIPESDRITNLFERITGRPIQPHERQALLDTYEKLLAQYQESPELANQLITEHMSTTDHPAAAASWTILANLILNLDEVICKN